MVENCTGFDVAYDRSRLVLSGSKNGNPKQHAGDMAYPAGKVTVGVMSSSDNSTSCWNFGDEREDPIHRIHSYPAKFPAFITTKALRYAKKQGVNVRIVADVFCGCGTSAVEAKKNGKNFWGCDINPSRFADRAGEDPSLPGRGGSRSSFDAIREEFRHTELTRSRPCKNQRPDSLLVRSAQHRRPDTAGQSDSTTDSRLQSAPEVLSLRFLRTS